MSRTNQILAAILALQIVVAVVVFWPRSPAVAAGDTVSVGDVIARPGEGKLGAMVHASIAGRITQVNESIVIEA